MALDDLALLLMSEGRDAEAREVAGRSVALREDAYALTMLGTLEIRHGRFDEAERHLARARQLAEEATYPNEELLAIVALAMQRLHEARGA
jgi:Flp pilus assembly protein TadD